MRRSICALAATGLLALTSCSGDDGGDDASEDFSVEAGLAQLPESLLDDGWLITAGDIDRASELAGERKPSAASNDAEAVADWSLGITGIRDEDGVKPIVGALLPEASNYASINQIDEIRDEVGWTLLDVSTFIELSLPPSRFTVMTGEFDRDEIDAAVDSNDDDVWSIGEDDFEVDLDDRSAARPLGEALRLAERDGRLAVSKSTPPIEQWVEGDDDTLADDEDISAVAAALDDQDVYAAMIVDGSTMSLAGANLNPEQIDAAMETALQVFEVLGVGLTVVDDQAVAVFVYQHDDEDAAAENADRLEQLLEDGTSLVSRDPLSSYFGHTEVEVDGTTVTLTAELDPEVFPRNVWQMVFSEDILATHA
jgi:hypothetical protein